MVTSLAFPEENVLIRYINMANFHLRSVGLRGVVEVRG